MKDIVQAINVLLDKIYTSFILRDVWGKIIPGIIFSISILSIISLLPFLDFDFNFHTIIRLLNDMNVILWIILIGIFWIMGFLVQSFGELFWIINYYRDYEKNLKKNNYYTDYEKMYEKQIELKNKCGNDDDNGSIKNVERYVVIMEACGNTASAIAMSSIIYLLILVGFLTNFLDNEILPFASNEIKFNTFIIILFLYFIYIIIGLLLFRMHKHHSMRYRFFMDKVLELTKKMI